MASSREARRKQSAPGDRDVTERQSEVERRPGKKL
jgi:hypothetical protein